TSGCYWERTSGFSGELDDIIANEFTSNRTVVTIAPTDRGFSSSGCGTFTANLSAVTTSRTAPFADGTYIVGTDIAPGTWRGTGGSGCYWGRGSGFSGELGDVSANDFGSSGPVVTITSADRGFETDGCGSW